MPNLRKLLFPFSVIYQGVTEVRNKLYDRNILSSESYELPVIAVGNLNMGGTGKSPMIEYLLNFLEDKRRVAVLSRGYKRKSKGFRLVEQTDEASSSGDEPLQFKNKFPDALVAVDANRREGIAELLKLSPDLILLDDAYQHRKVKAGFYILLTAYDDLYVHDLVLPAGNLRESRAGARRADVIVVTKCPGNLNFSEMEDIKRRLRPEDGQSVYFTTIKYAERIKGNKQEVLLRELRESNFALVTGIANPKPLLEFLKKQGISYKHYKFPDHHNFSTKEIAQLKTENILITTEKDYMRLKNSIAAEKLFYLPIEVDFLQFGEKFFREEVLQFINKKEV